MALISDHYPYRNSEARNAPVNRSCEVKERIVFVASHLYLFWTMAVYYIYELAENYEIILVVPEHYKKNEKFQNFCCSLNITNIVYLSGFLRRVPPHVRYSRLAKGLIEQFRPRFIFQHNYLYIHNVYFFYWARELMPGTKIFIYLGANFHRNCNTSDVFKSERKKKVDRLFGSSRILAKIFLAIVDMKNALYEVINHCFYWLLLGRCPYRLEYPDGTAKFNGIKPFDAYFVYRHSEQKCFERSFGLKDVFPVIQSPLQRAGADVHKLVYPGVFQEKNIIVFPTSVGFAPSDKKKTSLNKWIDALRMIHLKFPGYNMLFKCHPGIKRNKHYFDSMNFLKSNCPFVTILDPLANAFEWILKSEIVVGSFSTTLWWASFLKDKVIINLDFSDFFSSADMRGCESINYACGIEGLKELLSAGLQQTVPAENNNRLSDFLRSKIEAC